MILEYAGRILLFLGISGLILPLLLGFTGCALGFEKFYKRCFTILSIVAMTWIFTMVGAGMWIMFQVLILGVP